MAFTPNYRPAVETIAQLDLPLKHLFAASALKIIASYGPLGITYWVPCSNKRAGLIAAPRSAPRMPDRSSTEAKVADGDGRTRRPSIYAVDAAVNV